MELVADRDPEEARELLDPVLERMMEAVDRYEGTVNQVMGDGIMALFGAPLAHEDQRGPSVLRGVEDAGVRATIRRGSATRTRRGRADPCGTELGRHRGEHHRERIFVCTTQP